MYNSFEDTTLIASQLCDVPIALVSLFESKSPKEDIFSEYTIKQGKLLVIGDTLTQSPYAENDFVLNAPFIRFYAGFPLFDKEGTALGTLCVMDLKPRMLTDGQLIALEALGRQVVNVIELSKNQNTIIHSARLSSLGEMANGVAHELNNPLSVIDHAIEKMSRVHRFDPSAMFMMQNAVHKITRIISGLRSYARSGENDPKEIINIRALLSNAMEFYSSRAKEDGVYLELTSSEKHVAEARQTQISQIIMNLLLNAFEAAHHAEIKWISVKSYEEDENIVIEVADSGPGIDKSLADKIFDPFYTTRNTNESVGLGLSISKKMAEENGGSLFLDPTSAETKFILKLKKETKKSSLGHWPELPTQPLLAS